MKVLIQRVKQASVTIDNNIISSINDGILLFVGFTTGDDETKVNYIINKIINLRIFDDENGIMNKSIMDINGEILSISQFTLYADTASSGNRPSYSKALKKDLAEPLYNLFNENLSKSNIQVKTGKFGADMQISLINDGPVTIIIEK